MNTNLATQEREPESANNVEPTYQYGLTKSELLMDFMRLRPIIDEVRGK